MDSRVLPSAAFLAALTAVLLPVGPATGQVPAAAAKAGTPAKAWNPPRTPDGAPDLQGV